METKSLKINCLGASNTRITKTLEKETIRDVNYPVILGLLLRCTVRNYGVSGTNIAVCDARHDSYLERAETMDRDADLVIIQGDGNDASHGLPLGIPGERNPRTFCGALGLLTDFVRREYPQARILAVTGMKKRPMSAPRADGLTHTDFHNAFLASMRLSGIEPVDMYGDALLSPANPEMMPDALHMSERGCRHYADVLADLIRNM